MKTLLDVKTRLAVVALSLCLSGNAVAGQLEDAVEAYGSARLVGGMHAVVARVSPT